MCGMPVTQNQHAPYTMATRAQLQPIYLKPEALPFETIALDFITKLPESEGSDSILTITDHAALKPRFSFLVEKKSRLKKLRGYMSDMSSCAMAYLRE
jgi:hypothetical protein